MKKKQYILRAAFSALAVVASVAIGGGLRSDVEAASSVQSGAQGAQPSAVSLQEWQANLQQKATAFNSSVDFSRYIDSQVVSKQQVQSAGSGNIVCPQDAKQCLDGSYVSRVAPSCNFAACPEAPASGSEDSGTPEISTEFPKTSAPEVSTEFPKTAPPDVSTVYPKFSGSDLQCDNIDAVVAKVRERIDANLAAFNDRQANWDAEWKSNIDAADQALQSNNQQLSTNRQAVYDMLLASATTDAQKQAVEKFRQETEAAAGDYQEKVDQAVEDFRASMKELRDDQQDASVDAVTAYQQAVDKALADVKAQCQNAATEQTAVQNLQSAVQTAGNQLDNSNPFNVNALGNQISTVLEEPKQETQDASDEYLQEVSSNLAELCNSGNSQCAGLAGGDGSFDAQDINGLMNTLMTTMYSSWATGDTSAASALLPDGLSVDGLLTQFYGAMASGNGGSMAVLPGGGTMDDLLTQFYGAMASGSGSSTLTNSFGGSSWTSLFGGSR